MINGAEHIDGEEIPEPIFTTLLADSDGFCRWKCRLPDGDVGEKYVHLLIWLAKDGTVAIATRPITERTWSPPVYCRRV